CSSDLPDADRGADAARPVRNAGGGGGDRAVPGVRRQLVLHRAVAVTERGTGDDLMDVGIVLPQIKAEWDDVLATARRAEELGADSAWVVDHLTWMPPHLGILEPWTVLSALAASTERLELGAQVFCQSFRNPALLAKMAATLDRVSAGRFRLLVGAGWFEDEYRAFGYDFPPPGVRVAQLEEAVRILKGTLGPSAEPFTFEGEHYRVHEIVNTPQPVRAPLPVEVGGAGDRVLRIVARHADGWN